MDDIKGLDLNVTSRVISDIYSTNLNSTEEFFFKQDDYRVFFINTHSSLARQILCEVRFFYRYLYDFILCETIDLQAYLRGYTHPKYVWLTYGWYQDRWWTEEVNPEPTNCTDYQLAEVLHRSLTLEQILQQKHDAHTTLLVRYTELTCIQRQLIKLLNPQNLDDIKWWLYQSAKYYHLDPFIAGFAYDALWTFALALNRTSDMVQNSTRQIITSLTGCNVPGELVPLENFTYSNQLMGCIIRWNLERTDFVGVSVSH